MFLRSCCVLDLWFLVEWLYRCWSVHHFGPDCNISTAMWWIAMKFYILLSLLIGWRLLQHYQVDILILSEMSRRLQFGSDSHVPLRMNYNNLCEPLTFDLAPSPGQIFWYIQCRPATISWSIDLFWKSFSWSIIIVNWIFWGFGLLFTQNVK